MELNFARRIILTVALLFSLSLALLVSLCYTIEKKNVMKSTVDDIEQLNKLTADSVDNWMKDAVSNLASCANQELFHKALDSSPAEKETSAHAIAECERIVKASQYYEVAHLVDTNGLVIASSVTNAPNKLTLSDRLYFKETISGRKAYISGCLISKSTGNPMVAIGIPIFKKDTLIGVFVGTVNMVSFCQRFLDAIKIKQTGYIFLADSDGTLMAHPDKQKLGAAKLSQYDWGQKIMQSQSGTIVYKYSGEEKLLTFGRVKSFGWIISGCAPMTEMTASARQFGRLSLALGAITLVLAVFIVSFVLHKLIKPLIADIHRMGETAKNVRAGAAQIKTISQSLADGSSEQAASLEETSSSLEEMTAMTKHNAQNAKSAKTTSDEAKLAAESGAKNNQALIPLMSQVKTASQELHATMDAVKASNDEVSKIIKTIDEIAFQTNILALNAAVEAARAGESGLGFAVVADEVRRLAQKSAQAAKDSAGIIEAAVQKSLRGVQVSDKVQESLDQVFGQVDQMGKSLDLIAVKADGVDKLVGEITTASIEQNQGIEQVNAAMTKMNTITQSNATNAEASANVSEQLNEQSEAMKKAMNQLLQSVEGKSYTDSTVVAGRSDSKSLISGLLPQKSSNSGGRQKKRSNLGSQISVPEGAPVETDNS